MEQEVNQASFQKMLQQLNIGYTQEQIKDILLIHTNLKISLEDLANDLQAISFKYDKYVLRQSDILKIQDKYSTQSNRKSTNFKEKITVKQNERQQINTQLNINNCPKSKMDEQFEKREERNQIVGQIYNQHLPQCNYKNIRKLDINNQQRSELIEIVQNCTQDQLVNFCYNTSKFRRDIIYQQMIYYEKIFIRYLKQINKLQENQEFYDFINNTHEVVWAFGRVVCESEGKINEQSILLEYGEKENQKCKLNLSQTSDYILYSNQFIAVNGLYEFQTKTFQVNEVVSETFQKNKIVNDVVSSYQLEEGKKLDKDDFANFIIAAGPYLLTDSKKFLPLEALLLQAIEQKADYLILMGPFIDENNEFFKTGEIQINDKFLTFEQMFQIFIDMIKNQLSNQDTIVYLIPSANDMLTNYPLPIPPYDKQFAQSNKINFLSNPSSFKFNDEATFHFISSNFTIDMIQSSIVKGQKYQPKREACLEQMLHMRTSCPLYPCTEQLNYQNWKHFQFMTQKDENELIEDNELNNYQLPDIIINPSFLQYPLQIFNSTLILNPGILCRGVQGGTYAMITYYLGNSQNVENKVKIEIKKI